MIGATVAEVKEAVEPVSHKISKSKIAASAKEWKEVETVSNQVALFGSRFAGLMLATDLMRHVGELSDVTAAQVKESRTEYRKASDTLAPFKRILNIYVSQWFRNIGDSKKKKTAISPAVDFLRSKEAEFFIGTKDIYKTMNKLSEGDRQIAQTAIDAAKEKKFFHWELEFPEAFYSPRRGTTQVIEKKDDPGFDAITGNPPYDVFVESQYDLRSEAAGTGNLFGHFIIRGIHLTKPGGNFSFVVPLSLSCGSDYEEVRKILYKNFGHLKTSHYSIRPAKLFPDVDQRITIFVAKEKDKMPCIVYSSRLYRFNDGEQAQVVLNAVTGNVGPKSEGYVPRVSDATGASIYKKIFAIKTTIDDFLSKDPDDPNNTKWWFHSVGRYWLKAYDSIPYFTRNRLQGISTNLHEMVATSGRAASVCVGIINSNLFYFWWIMQSDEFHLLTTEISSMPMPESLLSDNRLRNAVKSLMNDYQKNAIRKTLKIKTTIVEMDEIHARKSRPLIL